MYTKLQLIYATDPNGCIGYIDSDGEPKQPFHSKIDFNYFQNITLGNHIVMGRETCKALFRPLPNRYNWVLTHNPNSLVKDFYPLSSLAQLFKPPFDGNYRNIVFIGGADLYKQVENWVEDIYVTKYDNVFDITDVTPIYFTHQHTSDLSLVSSRRFTDVDSKTGQRLTGEIQHWKRQSSNILVF